MNQEYQEQVAYLYSLQKFGIKFGLSKTENLLKALGNPEQNLRFVHIGGTNGKGSVASFLAKILEESGYQVGQYSSPHLVRFTERFKIDGQEIGQQQVTELIKRLRSVMVPKEPPTFFEATTALALDYFAQQGVDLAILEVGMGGRLDATNVISPLLSIITNISLEHQEFLGKTILEVAREKAGIIKQNVPLITGAKQKNVLELFAKTCQEKQAPFFTLGKDFRFRRTKNGLHFYAPGITLHNLQTSLLGRHQDQNASLALTGAMLLREQGFQIPEEALKKGLQKTTWPGRMHLISTSPQIILDGAHNPDASRALARCLAGECSYRKMIMVLGVMGDKDVKNILSNLCFLADEIICTRPHYERAMEVRKLVQLAKQEHPKVIGIDSLQEALNLARQKASAQDLILITGSLFTVGESLSILDPENWQPDLIS